MVTMGRCIPGRAVQKLMPCVTRATLGLRSLDELPSDSMRLRDGAASWAVAGSTAHRDDNSLAVRHRTLASRRDSASSLRS
jgi:hypothetical protein